MSQAPRRPPRARTAPVPTLAPRHGEVLRALVAGYVAGGGAVSSRAVARALPTRLSPASVRSVLAELAELGLVAKAHHSAGRVPTARGLRAYVDQLLPPRDVAADERRELAGALREAGPGARVRAASRLLSERSHQLGFALPPRLERLRLRRVSFVRLSRERLLAILETEAGAVQPRVLEEPEPLRPRDLERMARLLNARLEGGTLAEVRERLAREARVLRSRADRHAARAVRLGLRALAAAEGEGDLVVATRLALLDQPELREPGALARLLETLETREKLVQILDRVLDVQGVRVAFGDEGGEPGLGRFAMVAAPYGGGERPLGALGVIGPRRMDYARVIPLVDCLSRLVTEGLRS